MTKMKGVKDGKFTIPNDQGPPMLINMVKCGKCKRWFHGGMTGWVCPHCNPQSSSRTKIKEVGG